MNAEAVESKRVYVSCRLAAELVEGLDALAERYARGNRSQMIEWLLRDAVRERMHKEDSCEPL